MSITMKQRSGGNRSDNARNSNDNIITEAPLMCDGHCEAATASQAALQAMKQVCSFAGTLKCAYDQEYASMEAAYKTRMVLARYRLDINLGSCLKLAGCARGY